MIDYNESRQPGVLIGEKVVNLLMREDDDFFGTTVHGSVLMQEYGRILQAVGDDSPYLRDVIHGIERLAYANPKWVQLPITSDVFCDPRNRAVVSWILFFGNIVRSPEFLLGLHGKSAEQITDDMERAMRGAYADELSDIESRLSNAEFNIGSLWINNTQLRSTILRVNASNSSLVDKNQRINDAYRKEVKQYQKSITDLERRNAQLVRENEKLRRKYSQLEEQHDLIKTEYGLNNTGLPALGFGRFATEQQVPTMVIGNPEIDARKHGLAIDVKEVMAYGSIRHATERGVRLVAREIEDEFDEEEDTFYQESDRLPISHEASI